MRALAFQAPSELTIEERPDPTLICGERSFRAIGRSDLCENWNGSGLARADGSTAELQASHALCLADYAEPPDQFRAGAGRRLQIRPHWERSVQLL